MTWTQRVDTLESARQNIKNAQCQLNVLTHTVLFECLALCDEQLAFAVRMCERERDANEVADIKSPIGYRRLTDGQKLKLFGMSGKSAASGERDE